MARSFHPVFLTAGLLFSACYSQDAPASPNDGKDPRGATGGAGGGGGGATVNIHADASATGGASGISVDSSGPSPGEAANGGSSLGGDATTASSDARPDVANERDASSDATPIVDPGSSGDGDFTVGPTYTRSADLTSRGMPVGRSFHFTLDSTNSQFFTGMDSTLLPANQHAFTRGVDVYIPARYRDGTVAPFMVIQDGPGQLANIKLALDNLTAETNPARRLPAFIAIAVANGGGDSKGSERGLEYDTMSARYARFIDGEILPAVLANAAIKVAFPNLALTKDPEGRGTIGCSSGGAAALTMGWFQPDLFHRIVTYSGTFVDQQDDDAAEEAMFPFGAWEYHSGLSLIANSDAKPLRIFLNANDSDNGATAPESGHHNWVLANQRTAAALKAKNYHYRYIFGTSAGHCDGKVQDATLADTLLWVWRGYPIDPI